MKLNWLLTLGCLLIGQLVAATEIDTTYVVQIGGIDQFISIQGANRDNPILLFLHGGPGQAASSQKEQLTSTLAESYVVVHWDQRNAGKTLEMNPSKVPVTIDLMKRDAEKVLDHLLTKFQREKVFVLAHSWGNVLGFHLVEKHPERVAAYIAVSPIVDPTKSQQKALKRLKRHFRKENNDKAIQQLASVTIPHAGIEDMVTQYRWQSTYDGEQVTDEMLEKYQPFFLDWEKKWMPVYQELYEINLIRQLKEISCPVYFFVGTEDYTTNFNITEKYYQRVKAPQKGISWFATGHNILALVPALFQNKVIETLSEY